jgi:hypothetical protein
MPGPGTWSAGDILTAADLNAIGVWTAYTPTVTQNGTRTVTVNHAEYCQINKLCLVNLDVTLTDAGTTANLVTVTVPVNFSSATTARVSGSGLLYDLSATDVVLLTAVYNSASTVRFVTETTTDPVSGLGVNPAFALASGDVLSLSLVYETV